MHIKYLTDIWHTSKAGTALFLRHPRIARAAHTLQRGGRTPWGDVRLCYQSLAKPVHINSSAMSYDEVEIEDMTWDEDLQAYTYQCPCGDLFQITLVRQLAVVVCTS